MFRVGLRDFVNCDACATSEGGALRHEIGQAMKEFGGSAVAWRGFCVALKPTGAVAASEVCRT